MFFRETKSDDEAPFYESERVNIVENNVVVSIVIPIYNVEAFLRVCLDSVEAQSFTSYEVILVNDGSTDSSAFIAQEYVGKHENWYLIHKENGGLSSARNAGIAEAGGEYICFIDSDDYIAPDYLQKLYEAACIYKSDMVIADYHEVDADGQDLLRDKGKELYQEGLVSREQILEALTYVGGYHFATAVVVAWNKLIKTEIMQQFSYREGVLHEDEFLIMPLLLACDRVVWTRDDIYAYRQREGSIMQDEKLAFRHLQVLDAFEERIWLSKSVGSEELTRKLKRAYFWDIEVWYYFMRTIYKVPWYRLYGFFAGKMWGALLKYGNIWGKRKILKYFVFAFAPELYLKYLYK